MQYKIAALLTLGGLSGCSIWPENGSGGYAEHEILQVRYSTAEVSNPKLSQLHHDWRLQDLRYQLLKLNKTHECLPALMRQSQEQNNRTIRTVHAELFSDAEVELLKFKKQLNSIEARMQELTGVVECTTKVANSSSIQDVDEQLEDNGKRFVALLELLNTTLQFSTSSSELLPQYQSYLSHAARILKSYPAFNLYIIGHADERGDAEHNKALSLSRAKKVKNVFVDSGIDVTRLIVLAKGDASPVISGDSDFELLANRRVELKLINKNSNNKLSSLDNI